MEPLQKLILAYSRLVQFQESVGIENGLLDGAMDGIVDAILDIVGVQPDESYRDGYCRDWAYEILFDDDLSSEEKLKRLRLGIYHEKL